MQNLFLHNSQTVQVLEVLNKLTDECCLCKHLQKNNTQIFRHINDFNYKWSSKEDQNAWQKIFKNFYLIKKKVIFYIFVWYLNIQIALINQ